MKAAQHYRNHLQRQRMAREPNDLFCLEGYSLLKARKSLHERQLQQTQKQMETRLCVPYKQYVVMKTPASLPVIFLKRNSSCSGVQQLLTLNRDMNH